MAYLPSETILKKYALKDNPLRFFQDLAVLRDERKRLNYIGLYGLMKILREVCRRQQINPELVNGLLPQQAGALFDGKITHEQLEHQLTEGVFQHISHEGEFRYAFGVEGQNLWKEVSKVVGASQTSISEVKGMVASRGHAKGIVRIIHDPHAEQAHAMRDNDILVTSMTRPEFLPLMKKAAAIVTDEGGISCHAAIVARELGKPCIIGTRNATQVLHDGDLVEVDAEKGIVRILYT